MATEETPRAWGLAGVRILICCAALVGALWLIVHGLWMQFQIEPTTENQEEASAGRWLFVLGAVAILMTVGGLVWLRRLRLLLASAALLLVPGGEVWAQRQTSPPSQVVAQVEAFDAPESFGEGKISDHGRSGQVEQWWVINPGTAVEDACAGLEAKLRRWADEGSVTADPIIRPCYLTATRKGGTVDAQVIVLEDRVAAVLSYSPRDS